MKTGEQKHVVEVKVVGRKVCMKCEQGALVMSASEAALLAYKLEKSSSELVRSGCAR